MSDGTKPTTDFVDALRRRLAEVEAEAKNIRGLLAIYDCERVGVTVRSRELNPTEQRVLLFIHGFIRDHGRAPFTSEFDTVVRAASHLHRLLNRLDRGGLITREPYKPANTTLTDAGHAMVARLTNSSEPTP